MLMKPQTFRNNRLFSQGINKSVIYQVPRHVPRYRERRVPRYPERRVPRYRERRSVVSESR